MGRVDLATAAALVVTIGTAPASASIGGRDGGSPECPEPYNPREICDSLFGESSAVAPRDLTREWIEGQLTAGFGKDTNVELVGRGVLPERSKSDHHFQYAATVDWRKTGFALNGAKAYEVGLLASSTRVEQGDISSASQKAWTAQGYFDWRRPTERDRGLAYAFGLLFAHSELRLGDAAFSSSNRVTLAASILPLLRIKNECELTRTLLYVTYEDFEDRQRAGAALDRDGDHSAVGLRQTFGPYHHARAARYGRHRSDRWYCMGGGVFRQNRIDEIWSLDLGYEHRWERTVNSEFRRRVDELVLDGQWPLRRSPPGSSGPLRPKLLLDVDLEYRRSGDTRPSGADDLVRDDRRRVADVGLIVRLVRQSEWRERSYRKRYLDVSLRAGVRFVEQRSTLDTFEYDRTVYGLLLDVAFGRRTPTPQVQDTPSPGSTTEPGTGSGPDRPRPSSIDR